MPIAELVKDETINVKNLEEPEIQPAPGYFDFESETPPEFRRLIADAIYNREFDSTSAFWAAECYMSFGILYPRDPRFDQIRARFKSMIEGPNVSEILGDSVDLAPAYSNAVKKYVMAFNDMSIKGLKKNLSLAKKIHLSRLPNSIWPFINELTAEKIIRGSEPDPRLWETFNCDKILEDSLPRIFDLSGSANSIESVYSLLSLFPQKLKEKNIFNENFWQAARQELELLDPTWSSDDDELEDYAIFSAYLTLIARELRKIEDKPGIVVNQTPLPTERNF